MIEKSKVFSRAELYELVWSMPMQKLAGQFGLSDVGLAKACKRAGIPLPERGYWAKKAAGKQVIMVPLGPRFPGASDEVPVGFGGRYFDRGYSLEEALHATIPPEPVFEESLESVEARARKMVGRVNCPNNFDNVESQIAQLLAHDEARRKDNERFPSLYTELKYERGPERRRLLLLNALFLALRHVGCRPYITTSKWQVNDRDRRGISVDVGGTWVRFTLELVGQRRTSQNSQRNSERLRLDMGDSHDGRELAWEDNDERRIERCLTDIATAIIVKGEENYRHQKQASRKYLIERKAEAERLALEEQKQREHRAREALEKERQRRIDELLRQAADLRIADSIRSYVALVNERIAAGNTLDEKFRTWAEWAIAEADRIDPTKNGTCFRAMGIVE